jgi:GntR family transcriptional regulator, trigonelline degradation regulator
MAMDDQRQAVSSQLRPLAHESAPLRRKISKALRQAIEAGVLASGARLVEKDLCHDLGVSRTSLREALRELEAEGLLARGPRGVVVAHMTVAEAKNIYAVREALEGLIAAQFAQQAVQDDFEALDAVMAALQKAYSANDFAAIVSEKDLFYEVLCRGAQNALVLDLLTRLNSKINRLRSLSRSNPKRGTQSLKEIKAIVKALRARNPDDAREAAVHHVQRAARAALALYEGAK